MSLVSNQQNTAFTPSKLSAKQLIIEVHADRGVLIAGDKQTCLGQQLATTLLVALIDAANRSQTVSSKVLIQHWHQHNPRALPDRTAIARALLAVQKALAHLLPDGQNRVTYAARHKTVGPWQLHIAADEAWLVQSRNAATAYRGSCCLQLSELSDDWAKAAQALALADDFMLRGAYTECCEILQHQLTHFQLTPSAQCLWMLRIVRSYNRMGDNLHAKLWAEKAARLLPKLGGVFVRHVAAELAVLQQRWKFNALPVASSSEMVLDELIASAQSAPSALLLAQAENLKGLALRRLLAKNINKNIDLSQEIKSLLDTTCTAYFWACVAQDGYYQQAIATNMGYLMHWLNKHKLHNGGEACLQWFALARTLVDRFELPQDSAWDYLMVGTAYMECAQARAQLKTLAVAWPDAEGPDTEAFYARGVQLAQSFGDARQRIISLDLLAKHYQQTGYLDKLAKAKAAWAKETHAHPEVVNDIALDY